MNRRHFDDDGATGKRAIVETRAPTGACAVKWPAGNTLGAVDVDNAQLLLALDLVGTFFFAVSGALLAGERGFDIVASVLLAGLAGLGGGVTRDLIIGQSPPAAFAQPVYFLPPVIAAAVVFFFYSHVKKLRRTLLLFDAAGLALFCVTGTVKALQFGLHPAAAVLLGAVTGVGGGILRDVVANVVPSVVKGDLYILPAVVGASITAALVQTDNFNGATGILAAAVVFVLRGMSLRYRWQVPHAFLHPRTRR